MWPDKTARRISADRDRVFAGLNPPFLSGIPDGEIGLFQIEGDDFRFARLQMNPQKAFQGFDRRDHAGGLLAHIKLGYFVAFAIAGVGDLAGNQNILRRCGPAER